MRTTSLWALLTATSLFTSCSGGGKNDAPSTGTTGTTGASNRLALHAVPIDGLPTIGERDALVTIVEFTDYDCPFCGKAEHTIETLRRKYGADLRVAVAMHPLPMHPHARPAAIAALSASDSNSFADYHATLFLHPDERTDDELDALAKSSGVHTRGSKADAEKALAGAEALASSLHVKGTPSFFVNGRKITGAQPLATFDAVVVEELAHARDIVSQGTPRSRVYDAILAEARANPAPLDDPAEEEITIVPAAKTVGGAHLIGDAHAATTIVLFTDFQCPYCKKLDARFREAAASRSDFHVVLRNKPLPMHPNARLAAKAAIAAESQGKLEPYAKLLFDHQDTLDRDALVRYADMAGLDRAHFLSDLDSAATAARLEEDEALAERFGVKGTPTSFVEGRRVVGAQPLATFLSP
jgi:protein-disulfide isomerase